MSEPQNANSRYRTYSYHHILIVSGSTSAAEALANDPAAIQLGQRGSTSEDLQGTGGAFYLINGMVDSHFVIKSAWWEAISKASTGSTNASASAGNSTLEGEIIIEEPAGIDFLNTCIQISRALGANPINQVWLLKTIFVGYTDSGTQEIVADIAPVLLKVLDLVADIKSTGTTYVIQLVGIVNGAGHISGYDKQFTGYGYEPKVGETLGQVYKRATEQWNAQQLREYEAAKAKIDPRDPEKLRNLADNPPPVHSVQIAPELENIPYGDNTEPRNQNEGKKDAQIKIGPNESLADVYTRIGNKSLEIVGGNAGTPSPGANSHVNHTTTTNNEPGKVEIIHVIGLAERPTNSIKPYTPPASEDVKIFYYTFTGRNTDIKDLDLKLKLGAEMLRIAGAVPGQAKQVDIGSPNIRTSLHNTEGETQGTGAQVNTKLPNNPGSPIARESNNAADTGLTGQYFSALREWIRISNIEIKMTIIGDPVFLNQTNILPSQAVALALGQTTSTNTLSSNPIKIPTFVQLMIRYPAKTGDYSKFELLYDGIYRILKLKHIFDGGEFTQELTLLSIVSKGPLDGIAGGQSDSTSTTPTSQGGTAGRYAGPTEFGTSTGGKFANKEEFIKKMYPIAKKISPSLGNVDPAILVAQWGLESGYGSRQPRNADGSISHNLGGIKASSGWKGPTTRSYTDADGPAGYRSYGSYEEYANDYAKFIAGNKSGRYSQAIDSASAGDHEGYIRGLKGDGTPGKGGYATDPNYINSVLSNYRKGDIQRVAGQIENTDTQVATTQTPAQDASANTAQTQAERAIPTDANALTAGQKLAILREKQNSPPPQIIPERS